MCCTNVSPPSPLCVVSPPLCVVSPPALQDVQDLQNEVVNGLKAAFKQHLDSNHGRVGGVGGGVGVTC